jgi:hypothetical protein
MTESSGQLRHARFSLAAQDGIKRGTGRQQFGAGKGGQRAGHRHVRAHARFTQGRDERQMLRHPVSKEDGKNDQARLRVLRQCDDCAHVLIRKVSQLRAQTRALQHRRECTSRQTLLALVFNQQNVNA